ncbi:MAG: helix-turn-helix domain-containing protein [Variovorax sp.]|nr:helix-turn-helix domain-containing protein [Variovorax sp.]
MEKGVPVRSISRCLALLQFVNRHGPASLMEIARAISLPYPTTIRIVQTLVHEGMLECEPVRKYYRVTDLVQTLAVGSRESASLVTAARAHLVALTQKHGWPTSIATAVGPSMMLRDSTYDMTSMAFNKYSPGYTFPMLECAAGHAHIAFASDTVRDCLLDGLASDYKTSVALAMFRSGSLIRRIRKDGYAMNDRTPHSMNPGKCSSIAVPILEAGCVAGVLSLTFFSSSMPMAEAERRYAADLLLHGRAIGQAMESRHHAEAAAQAAAVETGAPAGAAVPPAAMPAPRSRARKAPMALH